MLFFTSPIGLGHASRDAAIANHLSGVRFVSGQNAAAFLREYHHTVHDVYRPPALSVHNGTLGGRTRWLVKYYAYYRRCRGVAGRIMDRYKPDVVVSDEDFAAVAEARKRNIRTILITDILESRFASGVARYVERRMNGAMMQLINSCSHVIMPEFGDDHNNIHRVGPIVRDITESRDTLRNRYKMRRKTVLVTVGGTDAGSFLIDAMKSVTPRLAPHADVIVVGGPSLDNAMVRDLHHMVYAADLVVSLAGRSTMDEASTYGTPGIFIPIRGHFEQEDNARRAGRYNTDTIYDAILENIRAPRRPVPTRGAESAAAIIRDG